MAGPKREKLDFESSEDRQQRLGQLLSSMSTKKEDSGAPGLPLPAGRPRTYHVGESDALARARQFLPLLASSNADLLKRHAENPDQVNIENTNADEKVIAMDVGLGVYDVNGEINGDLGPEVEIDEERRKQYQEKEEGEDQDEEMEGEHEEDRDDETGSEDDTDSSVSSDSETVSTSS